MVPLDPLPPSDPLFITPPPQSRQSVSGALKTAATSPVTPVVAFITALTTALTALQAYQGSRETARVSYETLKLASETQAAQLEALRKGQLDLRVYVEELSSRLERRQVSTEKAITRKVNKPSAPSLPPAPVEPAPKAPAPPAPPAPASLPPFDALGAAAAR